MSGRRRRQRLRSVQQLTGATAGVLLFYGIVRDSGADMAAGTTLAIMCAIVRSF